MLKFLWLALLSLFVVIHSRQHVEISIVEIFSSNNFTRIFAKPLFNRVGLKCLQNISKLIVEDQTQLLVTHPFSNSVGIIHETGRESSDEDC